jgi:hypothetical protein
MAKKYYIARIYKGRLLLLRRDASGYQGTQDKLKARSWDKEYKAERAFTHAMSQTNWKVVHEPDLAAMQEEVDQMAIQKVLTQG